MPQRGTNLPTEIACYSLPYGGLGFASHVLTFYTIVCLAFGRRPLWPFKRITHSIFGIGLSAVGLVGGLLVTVVTILRCKNHWQLLVLAIWKLSMSLFNGIAGLHVAIAGLLEARPAVENEELLEDKEGGEDKKEAPKVRLGVFSWFAIYVPGMLAGFVGLISLIVQNWPVANKKLHLVVQIFGAPLSVGLMVMALSIICCKWKNASKVVGIGVRIFLIVTVLFGDWALGAMANNLLGVPTSDQTLYYLYWFSKRLTMFSL